MGKRRDRGTISASWLRVPARVLLSGMFIHGGYHAFRDPGRRPQQAAKIGIPHPEPATTLTRVNGLTMAVGGAALALGIAPRVAATALACSLVPTTLAGHRFWEQDDGAARRGQTIHFLKNLSMMGGLMYVIADN